MPAAACTARIDHGVGRRYMDESMVTLALMEKFAEYVSKNKSDIAVRMSSKGDKLAGGKRGLL